MDTLETIAARRSVRRYDPSAVIDEATARKLIAAACRAPSALNLQHAKFVIVRDPAVREALRNAAHGQRQVAEAGLYAIVCADTRAYEKNLSAILKDVAPERRVHVENMVRLLYGGKPQAQRDEAIRSGALAAENLMLAAKALGYDSVPMVGFDFEKTAELIRLPEGYVIVMSVAIGKALDGEQTPRTSRLPYEDVVRIDRF